jgi:hypothetical protein
MLSPNVVCVGNGAAPSHRKNAFVVIVFPEFALGVNLSTRESNLGPALLPVSPVKPIFGEPGAEEFIPLFALTSISR